MFRSTDTNHGRWAVRAILIRHRLAIADREYEYVGQAVSPDLSDIYDRTAVDLDRLYSGEVTAQTVLEDFNR